MNSTNNGISALFTYHLPFERQEHLFHSVVLKWYCPFLNVLSDCIKRIFHGCTEIQNFSSSVEKFLTSECSKPVKYFLSREEKFCVSKWPCDVLFIIKTPMKYQPFHFKIFCCKRANLLYGHSNGDLSVTVKMTCFFHVWRHHVFTQKLTWYFISLYIIK